MTPHDNAPYSDYKAVAPLSTCRNCADLDHLVMDFCTAVGEPVPVDAIARVKQLHAVAKAASVYVREFDHLIGKLDYPERTDLKEALALLKLTPPGETT